MPPPPRLIVIDTQSLFDWLLFQDAACTAWDDALSCGSWQWIHTPAMRAEFDFVLAKGFGARWPVHPQRCAAAWTRLGREVAPPAALGATDRLHCSDADDQKFIDLAIAAGAHTLVSRDKALLKLARKAAARHALRVCTPRAWSAQGLVEPRDDGVA